MGPLSVLCGSLELPFPSPGGGVGWAGGQERRPAGLRWPEPTGGRGERLRSRVWQREALQYKESSWSSRRLATTKKPRFSAKLRSTINANEVKASGAALQPGVRKRARECAPPREIAAFLPLRKGGGGESGRPMISFASACLRLHRASAEAAQG